MRRSKKEYTAQWIDSSAAMLICYEEAKEGV